jgi:hypothetical protein
MAATLAVRRARIGPFKRPRNSCGERPGCRDRHRRRHGLLSHHLTEITIDN